ncbi:MAG TPA: hypothetical protein VFQ39_09945, partial [Longimicrobium sp.]|nr:hypothetical protein [Longimicrobium sp.]
EDRYEVALRVKAKKIRADSLGNETPLPMDDFVDVGVYTFGDDAPFFLRRVRIHGDTTLRVMVDDFPVRAGIDPLHKLIDRRLNDNVIDVVQAATPPRPRGGDTPAARPRGIAEPPRATRDTARM